MQRTDKIQKRNLTIDLLRMIGLFLVIAAHCEFPEWFYEFREFDVVLLVAVSGMSFYAASSRITESYAAYVKKRFFRLVLPVWIFLVCFFVFFRILGVSFSTGVILKSFLLLSGGILFIWVYRIFFVNALLNPLLKQAADHFPVRTASLLLAGGLVLNEVLYRFVGRILPETAGKLFDTAVIYTLGYALISFAGILWEKAELNERIYLTAEAGILFVITILIGGLRGFSEAKYPPQLYYISYGLLVTFVLYLLLDHIRINEKAGQIITWLSVNTMRIYMWHIFLYYLLDTLSPVLMRNAWLTYSVLLGGGILGSLIQEKFQGLMKKR